MINILKLRQLEKEKKQQAVTGEKGSEPVLENIIADSSLTENENSVKKSPEKPKKKSGNGQSNKSASTSKKKKVAIIEKEVFAEPETNGTAQEIEELADGELIVIEDAEESLVVTEETLSENKEPEIDPAELFRQNLIAQVLQDESMISREEYLKEIGALTPAEAESAEEAMSGNKGVQPEAELPEPVPAAEPVPPVPAINNAVRPPEPEPEIKRAPEKAVSAGGFKSSEYEKNDDLKNKKGKESIIQMVGFTIGNEYYGVDICKIKEINRMTEITKVPRAPEFIEGVINLRGSVIPVINLRTKVRMPKKAYDKDTRIIIVELSGRTIGFIVDGVREVLRIPDTLLDPPPALAVGKRADYITHVAKLEDDLVILMDPEKVLSNDELGRIK